MEAPARGTRRALGRNMPPVSTCSPDRYTIVSYGTPSTIIPPRAHVVDGVLLVVFPRVLDLKRRQAVEGEPPVPKLEPVRHNGRPQFRT